MGFAQNSERKHVRLIDKIHLYHMHPNIFKSKTKFSLEDLIKKVKAF